MEWKNKGMYFSHMWLVNRNLKTFCTSDGWRNEEVKEAFESDCEKCCKYKNRFIEYPITINSILNREIKNTPTYKIGSPCEIRPCAGFTDEFYVGTYLGELPISISSSLNENTWYVSLLAKILKEKGD